MPMKLIKSNLIIGLVLLLALFLRSYHLDSYPPLNPDEAAIGYNAFSLIQTGLDEHGTPFPLHFKSFGDFKPGGYFYLVLPFVKFLGLNTLSVRLPNLILSILSIFYLYLIVKELSKSTKLATISALILSINPWHIHFSRGGWESSAALAFIIIGTYYFIKQKYYFFILSFVFSLYIYHSARIFAPLLGLSLLFTHKEYFISHKTNLVKLILLATIISLPVLFSFINNGGTTRFGGVGITADQGPLWRSNELLNQHQPFALTDRIIHNKRILYLFSWIQKYTSHFDLNFLFLRGDDVPRSKIPNFGQFYLLELPLLLYGLYLLIHKSSFKKFRSIILLWILIAPIASSLTFQAPSALRALPLSIPFVILIAICLYQIRSKIFILVISIIYIFSLIFYFYSYHFQYQKIYSTSWGYGFDQIVPIINSQKNIYSHIYFTDKYDQPYILYLFFTKYPPQNIHSQIKLSPPDQYGFSTVKTIDNINFEKIKWDSIPPNSFVITSDEPIPIDPKIILDFPNGSKAFKIYIKP